MSAHAWPPRTDDDYRREAAAGLGDAALAAFARVRLIVLDCDGVMTDGRLYYDAQGEASKAFDARDGLGLVLARAGGLKLALLTGRDSPAAARRAADLRFHAVKLGRFDKRRALLEILNELHVEPADALYMGDDLIDAPALAVVGAPVAVPGAPRDVRERCLYVTAAAGGAGAVREVCERVLGLQGRFGPALLKVAARAWLAPGDNPPAEDA